MGEVFKVDDFVKELRVSAEECFTKLNSIQSSVINQTADGMSVLVKCFKSDRPGPLYIIDVGIPLDNDKFLAARKTIFLELKAKPFNHDSFGPASSMEVHRYATVISKCRYSVAIQGFFEEINLAAQIFLLSKIIKMSPWEVVEEIRNENGLLYESFFREGDYLRKFLLNP